MRTLIAIALAMLLVAPLGALTAAAEPNASNTTPDPNRPDLTEQQMLDRIAAEVAVPSSLTAEQAGDLLAQIAHGNTPSGDEIVDLTRFVRDNQDTEAGKQAAEILLAALPTLSVQHSTDGALAKLADALTQGEGAACANQGKVPALPGQVPVPSPAERLCPSNAAVRGIYNRFAVTSSGCTPTWADSGFCWTDYANDFMALSSLDGAVTRDFLMTQVPVSFEYQLHWYTVYYCWWSWWGICFGYWSYRVYYDFTIPTDTVMGTNLQYEVAVPIASGTVATQAERDAALAAYDAASHFDYQVAPDGTSAAASTTNAQADGAAADALAKTPLGTGPGLGDLIAANPVVTAVGLQTTPSWTSPAAGPVPSRTVQVAKAELPAALAVLETLPQVGPIYGEASRDYNQLSLHGRDFGFAPGDSTGVNAIWRTSQLRSFHANVGSIRVNDLGSGSITVPYSKVPTLPAPLPAVKPLSIPGSLYYSAGWYFAGGNNLWTNDFSLASSVN